MVDTNFYDVIVCGGETSGLVAAALLARRGFRVLLVADEREQATFDAAGGALLAGARGVAAARRSAVGAPLQGARLRLAGQAARPRRAPHPRPHGQPPARSGRRRGDAGTRARALLRDRGADGDHGGGARAPGRARADRRAAAGDGHDLAGERLLGAPRGGAPGVVAAARGKRPAGAAGGRSPFSGDRRRARRRCRSRLTPSSVGSIAEARAFALARRGLHVLDGGLGALQELLQQRLETFGGDRRPRVEPVGVVVRRGRAVGVRVSPRDETIGCQWLIWAGPSTALRTTLGSSAPPAPARGRPAALRLTGYRYALSLLVGAQALPTGTPPRLLAIGDPTRPLVEDNALAITVGRSQPRDPERIPLWIECAVPAHLVDAGPSYLRALRGRLVQTLERLWPDFGKQIFVVASPYDGLGAERGAAGAAASAKAAATSVAVAPPPLYARPRPAPSTPVECRTPPGSRTCCWSGARTCPVSASRGSWSAVGAPRT